MPINTTRNIIWSMRFWGVLITKTQFINTRKKQRCIAKELGRKAGGASCKARGGDQSTHLARWWLVCTLIAN